MKGSFAVNNGSGACTREASLNFLKKSNKANLAPNIIRVVNDDQFQASYKKVDEEYTADKARKQA